MRRTRKLILYVNIERVLLFVILFPFSVTGNPLRCHDIESNTTEVNERVWQELVMRNNEMLMDEPLFNSTNWNHTVSPMLPVLSVEEFENQTIKQFELLKVNFSQMGQDIDKSKNDAECGSYSPKIMIERLTYLKQIISEIRTSITKKITCASCKAGVYNFLCPNDKTYVVKILARVGFLLYYIKFGKMSNDVINISYKFCIIVQTDRVCNGITQLFSEGVVYVFKRITLSPKEICSVIMNADCDDVYSSKYDWNLIFPPIPKPTVVTTPDFKEITPGLLKVLHLSDTHFDPYYEEGTNANCDEPLCCRTTSSPAKSVVDRAGRWGDYRACDTPKRTIDDMFQHINSTHPDITYILWTGDLPAHDVWNQTREGNVNILKQTVEQMSASFPGIPIYPALGNHETVPVNSFPSSSIQNEFAINWLYDELDKNWRRWLPASTSSTIRKGAFYSVLVKPGFRIISLNMNYCNNLNWWLLMNSTDPENELQWFIYELQSAELNEEKVHVIGHIPPGHSDCLKVWSRNYYSIINRFESTITAQFFGHTHFDEFEIFYDQKDLNRAIGISYICPSVTPFINLNPGYRIYYVDGDRDHSTRAVLDHETWVMNLDEANLYDYPTWYQLYSARDAYQMPNLTPLDWDNLVYKLAKNDQLFDKYFTYYWKNSSVKPVCDQECKQRMICDLRSGRSHDSETFCNEMKNRISIIHNSGRNV